MIKSLIRYFDLQTEARNRPLTHRVAGEPLKATAITGYPG